MKNRFPPATGNFGPGRTLSLPSGRGLFVLRAFLLCWLAALGSFAVVVVSSTQDAAFLSRKRQPRSISRSG